MIYDGLGAVGLYRGLFRGLDALIDWLAENDPASLPNGVTKIDGDRVFANVMDATTRTFDEARFETHRRYMDVQVDLDGEERFMTTPGAVVPAGDFDVAADKGYCLAAPGNDDLLEGSLAGGQFAVFMIGEPHMPNLVAPGCEPGRIRKVCFKVIGDQFWDEA